MPKQLIEGLEYITIECPHRDGDNTAMMTLSIVCTFDAAGIRLINDPIIRWL